MKRFIGCVLIVCVFVEAAAVGASHYLEWWQTLAFTVLGALQAVAGYWFADFDGLGG